MSLDRSADRVIARAGDRVLFEYVFRPVLPARLSPRPYFHPVRSLAGVVVTEHQPVDHHWHLGLAYSWPVVSGRNLWGGPSYRRGEGYVDAGDHGEIRHRGWDGDDELLEWVDGGGGLLASERRRMGEPGLDEAAGTWWLDLETEIRALTAALRLGSPTTEGRPMAGYAGLAWRGPASMLDGAVLLEDGAAGEDPMGRRSRWLGYAAAGVTVALFEHPANPRVPNRWFVRSREYPLATSSPVFDTPLELAADETLRLRHRVLVADGELRADRLTAFAPR